MKTKKKVMEPIEDLTSKKFVHIDNEIDVLVGNVSANFEDNKLWQSSVERLPDHSEWMENGQHLVLVGSKLPFPCTPTKWDTKPESQMHSVRLLKENLTPSNSRKASLLKCSVNVSSSPSHKITPKLAGVDSLLDKSSIISQQMIHTRLKCDSPPADLNGKSSTKHIVSESWEASLQQAKYVDSTTDVPSPTEGEVAPDTGRSSPSSSTTPEVIVESPNGKSAFKSRDITGQRACDGNRLSRRKKISREMRQLYVSLKEIPWAQHWSPKTFLGSAQKHCRASRKMLAAQLNISQRPSSIYAKFYPPKKDIKKNIRNRNIVGMVSKRKIKNGTKIVPDKKETVLMQPVGRVSLPENLLIGEKTVHSSAKKFVRLKDCEKRFFLKKESKASSELVAHKCSLKMKGQKISAVETQRTKSLAERFDFVAKPKKQLFPVETKIIIESTTATPPGQCIKKENDATGDYKSKVAKATEASHFKGKCENTQRMTILDSLLQQKESRKRKFEEDEKLRCSVRQSECAFRYKEIAVKKHHGYIQIILVPNPPRRNTLSLEALKELKEALLAAQKDPTCKVVLLNSSGKYFCCGLDLSPLLGPDKDKTATILAETLKSLVETLALFSKPLVAGVNGKASGFGVGLLPFCDVVLASDKATFHTSYAKLGYIPEAAATLTMPQVVGSTWATNMLLRSQKVTAVQAHGCGLVTEVLWPSKFMEEVVPRVQQMASQSLQVMEATKVMLRCHQWEKLQAVLQTESRLLSQQWLTPHCQKAIRQMLLT